MLAQRRGCTAIEQHIRSMTQERRKIEIENSLFVEQIRNILQRGAEKSVTFTVRGYSMRPFIENLRDKAVLVPPRPPRIGDVVLAQISDDTYALHRIIAIDGDTITLQGDGNSIRATETTTRERIVGTVTAFIRKGRYTSTNSRRWRLYSALWSNTRHIRAFLLTLYKIKKQII